MRVGFLISVNIDRCHTELIIFTHRTKTDMKINKKTLRYCVIIAFLTMAIAPISVSCNSNRYMTYEDGMFDYDDIYSDDSTSDTFQLNSEVENDDQERY